MGQLTANLSSKIKNKKETRKAKKFLPIAERKGVSFPKYFTQKLEPGKTPYDEVKWELRTAAIGNDKGAVRDILTRIGEGRLGTATIMGRRDAFA